MSPNIDVNKLHYVCANWQNTQKVQILSPSAARDYATMSGNQCVIATSWTRTTISTVIKVFIVQIAMTAYPKLFAAATEKIQLYCNVLESFFCSSAQ